MLRAFEPWHLLIIGGIATVLFGAKRLPDSARSLGQSLRILKSEAAASAGDGQPEKIEAGEKVAAAAPAEKPVPVETIETAEKLETV